ncbi:hypothetical protein AB852_00730 [Streptomyces uncialis]|uniref:Uncharacterized protein n=1 Tax=Streptomyces uncialis TaxID=1048205 RepID=A0A1Q4VCK1_9ACTN|nr:hypothetical protein AB852_00730 [Streptomyces uncialis]
MTRGPRPKANAVRRNTHDHAQVLQDSPLEGRVLPKALGISTGGARRFWKTWATSPQTAGWAETDWAELEITTKLVDAFYQGDTRHASEIRMRTAKWGGTVEDRARLRMTLELPENDDQDQDAMTVAADMDEELYRLLSGG